MKNIEKAFKFLLMFITFFVPVFMMPFMVHPFIASKSYLFVGLVLAVVPLYVYLASRNSDYLPSNRLLKIFAVPFALLMASFISGIFGESFHLSFWGSFMRSTGLLFLSTSVVYAYFVAILVKVNGPGIFRRFLWVLTAASSFVAFSIYITPFTQGIIRRILDAGMNGGLIGNTSFAAAFMMFGIFFALYLGFTSQSYKGKAFAFGAFLFQILTPIFLNLKSLSEIFQNPLSVIGYSKGAFIGVMTGIAVTVCIYFILSQSKKKKYAGVTGLAFLVVGVLVAFGMFLTPGTKLNQGFVEVATGTRFVFWEKALKGFYENPVFGTGPETFGITYQKHFNPIMLSPDYLFEGWVDKPHNVFLEWLTQGGVVGLALYLAFLILFFVLLYRIYKKYNTQNERVMLAIFSGLVAGYVLQNQFVFDTPTSYLAQFLLFGALAGLLYKSEKSVETPEFLKNDFVQIGVLLLSIFLIFTWSVKPFGKASTYHKYYANVVLATEDDLFRAYNKTGAGNSYDAGNLIDDTAVNLSLNRFEILPDEGFKMEALRVVDSFVNFSDKVLQDHPKEFRTAFGALKLINFKMFLTEDYGEENVLKAKLYAEHADRLSPDNPQILYELGQIAIYQGENELAIDYLERAIELVPYSLPAYYLLGGVYHRIGDMESLFKTIDRMLEYFPEEAEKLMIS